MSQDQMTAAEAERRLDSIYLCGGTPEERRYAIRRWKNALLREYAHKRATEPDQAKRAIAKAIR
jgi:hypothetical protein